MSTNNDTFFPFLYTIDLLFSDYYYISNMNDLQHLQKVILSIVKDIDELCRKNGIEYYLFGGSAIGAIRHKGFIPWDDDLDIVMNHNNYRKFVKVFREQLNPEKYYFQEGMVDWPALYSKVRLKGTFFEESESFGENRDNKGIFVDVFKLDNAPNSSLLRKWQYFCGKSLLAYCLLQRGYRNASIKKKFLMYLSSPLKVRFFRSFFEYQVIRYNKRETNFYASFGARFKYKNCFYKKELFSNPVYVPFEDTLLPVPNEYDELLTQIYGDYMTPPPVKEQVGMHLKGFDFGVY